MEEIRKEKLIHYLFPNEQIRYFLCEDLFVELYELIPKRLCISSTNFTNATRKENLKQVANIIEKFLKENSDYKIALKKCFPNKPTDIILRDLIIGYVFYLLNVFIPV